MQISFKVVLLLVLILIGSASLKAQEFSIGDEYVLTDDNINLYTKASGTGPLAIFIHGGPGAWSKSFEDLGGKNLESHLTMIYYDQRGCGRSQGSEDDDYSLERMLKDIDLVRRHYKAEKVYLIAHSFGGILAFNYAQKHPSHVKGLVMANSTLNLLYSIQNQIDYINSVLKTSYKAMDVSQIIPTFRNAQAKFTEEGLVYKLLSDDKGNIDLLHGIDRENPSNYDFAKKALEIGDYLKDYTTMTNRIKIPVLIISGKRDHAIGEEHFESFRFPNETVKQIDGGHLLYYENNREFTDAIFQFVEKNNE